MGCLVLDAQAGSDIFHIEQFSISFLSFGKSSSDSTDCVNHEKVSALKLVLISTHGLLRCSDLFHIKHFSILHSGIEHQ